jgi:hypothetical protein
MKQLPYNNFRDSFHDSFKNTYQKKLTEEVPGKSLRKKFPEETPGRSSRKKLPEETYGISFHDGSIFIRHIILTTIISAECENNKTGGVNYASYEPENRYYFSNTGYAPGICGVCRYG